MSSSSPHEAGYTISSEPTPGDIIISGSNLDTQQYAETLAVLAEMGIHRTIAGGPASSEAAEHTSANHLLAEVNEWSTMYGPSVDATYLEEVTPIDNPDSPQMLLTDDSIRMALEGVFGKSPSTSISARRLSNNVTRAVARLSNKRDYVQQGAFFLGSRKRPGYYCSEDYWGVTPGTLYGLSLETDDFARPLPLFSATTVLRINQVLRSITNQAYDHPNSVVRRSDWLGHARDIRVG